MDSNVVPCGSHEEHSNLPSSVPDGRSSASTPADVGNSQVGFGEAKDLTAWWRPTAEKAACQLAVSAGRWQDEPWYVGTVRELVEEANPWAPGIQDPATRDELVRAVKTLVSNTARMSDRGRAGLDPLSHMYNVGDSDEYAAWKVALDTFKAIRAQYDLNLRPAIQNDFAFNVRLRRTWWGGRKFVLEYVSPEPEETRKAKAFGSVLSFPRKAWDGLRHSLARARAVFHIA